MTGAVTDKPASSKKRRADGAPFEVTLVHARKTNAGWALFGLLFGLLLLWKLAIVGQVVGVIFLVVAALAAKSFIFTVINPPGTIEVADDKLTLPDGLCRGRSSDFTYDQVKHAFFLRRAVPWTRAGPVLVVEAGDLAFTYPRDWFASESEQHRVLHGILRRLEPHD